MEKTTTQDVIRLIREKLPARYMFGVWSRFTDAGTEIGVNLINKEGSRASLLPIDNDFRIRFADFLASEVLKYDTL